MTSPTAKIPVRNLGSQGLRVSAQGLGCMGLDAFYKEVRGAAASEDPLTVIRRAGELGITFLDTSDVYGPHTNEKLLSPVLAGSGQTPFSLHTKCGLDFVDGAVVVRGDRDYIRRAVQGSLERLGIGTIDLYYLHRVDPKTPIEESVAAMAELVKEGKVRYLGLSEVSAADLRRAHAVHPITAVQLEWSLWTRDAEAEIIPTCRELGIGIVAFSPLGLGFLTGAITSRADLDPEDWRLQYPRFSEENFDKNFALVDKVKEVAARLGAAPAQIALAWLHAQGEDVFPIAGTKRIKYLEQNAAAVFIKLSQKDLNGLDTAFPKDIAVGNRYLDIFKPLAQDNYST